MPPYMLVGSEDPFASTAGRRLYDLAESLVDHGDDVTVFLVQNGVLPCRVGSALSDDLARLASRTRVLADDFSLRERAIERTDLVAGVEATTIGSLVDAVMDEGRRALWM
jgi:sulfur relay (sulfurtransferase) complex TusBCD TusD component (DsrE family)